jgi:subtilase family serine protease
MHRRTIAMAVTAGLTGVAGVLALSGPALAAPSVPTATTSDTGSAVCDAGGSQVVSCLADRLNGAWGWHGHHIHNVGPASATPPAGYGPGDLQQAYNLTSASATNGRGETVAIVDAYDDPDALANLATYRAQYGLPPICGPWSTRGCVTVTKVNQRGAPAPLPTPDPNWSQEISVDLDTVSATCPNCNILLVEANAATLPSLGKAEDTAAAAHPVAIGNSFGVPETTAETNFDADFTHPGIAITAAAGDNGYGVQYPASSPDVIAVGGTTLSTAAGTSRGFTETAWSSDGSGCSTVEPQPKWQSQVSAITAACAERAVADVAAVADPTTGVAVYDTYQLPGWTVFGGTSVATQVIAGVYALAEGSGPTTGRALYNAPAGDFFDVTSGSDGTCGSDLCTAGPGWDGPTGLGTPDGTAAF